MKTRKAAMIAPNRRHRGSKAVASTMARSLEPEPDVAYDEQGVFYLCVEMLRGELFLVRDRIGCMWIGAAHALGLKQPGIPLQLVRGYTDAFEVARYLCRMQERENTPIYIVPHSPPSLRLPRGGGVRA